MRAGETVSRRSLPAWWHPLVERASTVDARQISRFVPTPGQGRPAAVLILLAEASDGSRAVGDVLLLERASTMRSHAGQPAFPGGASDPGDDGPAGTALREAAEEVGLDPTSATVVAALPTLWIPVSDFAVTPILAWWHSPHRVLPADPAEVAKVARIPVAELADPANRLRVRLRANGSGRGGAVFTGPAFTGPAFTVGDMLVWGFTAGLLDAVLDLAGWSRPWDTGRVLDLPPEAVEQARRTEPPDALC